LTQRALAKRLGVTHEAVNRFVRRHGLAGSGRQPFWARQARELAELVERRQQVLRLVQTGLTSTEVAKCLGVSPATIGLDRQALRLRRALKGQERRTLRALGGDEVREPLKAVSRAQLARELGVSSSAVYRYCTAAGITTCGRTPRAPLKK
jgi:predicted transcriptional regulator